MLGQLSNDRLSVLSMAMQLISQLQLTVHLPLKSEEFTLYDEGKNLVLPSLLKEIPVSGSHVSWNQTLQNGVKIKANISMQKGWRNEKVTFEGIFSKKFYVSREVYDRSYVGAESRLGPHECQVPFYF